MYEHLKLAEFTEQKSADCGGFVWASIYRTQGSSYRKAGVQMVIAENMSYAGALSGGCVEREVLRHASKVFFSKRSHILDYDGSKTLGCKGILFILLEYVPVKKAIEFARFMRRANLKRGALKLVFHREPESEKLHSGYEMEGGSIYFSDKVAGQKEKEFLILPATRLVVFGANHDVAPLARLAVNSGMQVEIILDRHFTNEQELKEFPCEFTSVPEYFTTKPPDERTAIVLMSHKFEHDLEALKYLFPHRPGYLAVLGPARRRMEMLDRIRKELPGLAREHENYLTTVKGPAGLNINARTPEEIGLSIVAQIVSIFNEASTK